MKIQLKKNEERRILAGHQWVFSNEIASKDDGLRTGDVVSLYSHNGKFLGKGFYNSNSLIAYRHLTVKDKEVNKDFIAERIRTADKSRKSIRPNRKVYRMVNSESDLLPGLIIDRYDSAFAIQIFSAGTETFLNDIADTLKDEYNAEVIIEKNDNGLRTLEGLERREGIIFGDNADKDIVVDIDGIKYEINILKGQKTGFYLDQADNRRRIREYVRDNDNILDLFCNEGGFALNCAVNKNVKIKAVDISGHAVNKAKRNAELNGFNNIDFTVADVFEYIKQDNHMYDVIILDPPSFTKSKKNVKTAIKGYEELNTRCMRMIKNGGLLFTYSCSHHISAGDFESIISKSASYSGKHVQIIEHSDCSYDHPVIPQMPETKYLKGYVIRVNNKD